MTRNVSIPAMICFALALAVWVVKPFSGEVRPSPQEMIIGILERHNRDLLALTDDLRRTNADLKILRGQIAAMRGEP